MCDYDVKHEQDLGFVTIGVRKAGEVWGGGNFCLIVSSGGEAGNFKITLLVL